MSKGKRVGSLLACAGLLAGTVSGCGFGFAEPSPFGTVKDFLIAWQVGNYTAAAGHTTGDRVTVAAALRDVEPELNAASLKLGLINGRIQQAGNDADAEFSVTVDLGENGDPWKYGGQMHLRRINGTWKIVWSPSVIHPLLAEGQRLTVVTTLQKRAMILDAHGAPLLQNVKTDVLGVYPGSLQNPDATLKAVASLTGLDRNRLILRVKAAPPQEFLPLVTLTEQPAHRRKIAALKLVEGIVLDPVSQPIQPKMAAEFLGTLGPATVQKLQQVGAPFQPGDTIGETGLQLTFQRRLAGIPSVTVMAQDPRGDRKTTLGTWPGKADPQPIQTTIDPVVQRKAEAALAALKVPASMVVIAPSSGFVQAVANHWTGGRDLALEAQYPPGMTFGIITAEALQKKTGQQNAQKVMCPATAAFGDKTVINRTGGHGSLSFENAFGLSCATTLATLGAALDPGALTQEANRFGIGQDWGLWPIQAFTGQVPGTSATGAKALDMVGQGGVLMSPIAMAMVSAAISSGNWRPPTLITSPALPVTIQSQPIDALTENSLAALMRQGVAAGTAKAAAVRGSQSLVYGIADTVQDARGKPVSWFVGYRGSYAIAIAIEGREDAAVIAHKFLQGF